MNLTWLDEWKEILVWTVGGLCALILCLMATFPYGALHTRLMAELHKATGMEVRVAEWAVALPLGLEWHNLSLSKSDWGSIQLAFLQAKVGILKVLGGGLGLDVVVRVDKASPNAGIATGLLTASSFSSLAGPLELRGELKQVDLSKVFNRYINRGVLNGEFSLRTDSTREAVGIMTGEGTWKAEVKGLALDQVVVGNGRTISLVFARISAELVCRDSLCDVKELKGDGIDGSFMGEGTMTMRQPAQHSQLALTVTVIPGAAFTSKASLLGIPPLPPGTPLTVKIVGTLAEPKVAL